MLLVMAMEGRSLPFCLPVNGLKLSVCMLLTLWYCTGTAGSRVVPRGHGGVGLDRQVRCRCRCQSRCG